jgi:hypothetical protein
MSRFILNFFLFLLIDFGLSLTLEAQTIALWCFDEQQGIYPSCVVSDLSDNDFPLVLGPGGQIVAGKYGNALEPTEHPEITLPESESILFGMRKLPIPEGRIVEPMNWHNANFCALMTSGENHLRKEVTFKQPTESKLNLGDSDWTVEFWLMLTADTGVEGVIFEIGEGPRGENDHITRLSLDADLTHFTLVNQPSNTSLKIATAIKKNNWQHLAFVYNSSEHQLTHYVDGKMKELLPTVRLKSLNVGEEDYMSIGRDGSWNRPLPGRIDELRFSEGMVYDSDFKVPGSFSYLHDQSLPKIKLKKADPLLFASKKTGDFPIQIGSRRHLFIDDALIEEMRDLKFVVNPPLRMERVIGDIEGSFRKHLNVLEDDDGLLRLYNSVSDDYLAVRISKDGIHWEIPELAEGNYQGHTNIVLHDPTGTGMVFIDPNAPEKERWKYLSGFDSRGIFLYSSADGFHFNRIKIAVLPFWAGSQSNIFYDEQQQKYISYHRADFARGVGGATQREFVMTETLDLIRPWFFRPSTQTEGWTLAKKRKVKDLLPFYLDNGLLTPGGFAFEYPNIFKPVDGFDPIDSDVYIPKAMKYPWAPDVYLAFPVMYFHYKRSSPETRAILWDEKFNRGSGPLETQLAVSRDAVNWKRYPRPAYVGIGMHQGRDIHTAYIAYGMVKRGNEIWQYYFGETQYHSSHFKDPAGRGVYRLVQRLDGFVSLDSPYHKEQYMITKPLIFKGNRLLLNIDTDATGYTQVGLLDKHDKSIAGFSVDECIYINGDFIETAVEWAKKGKDISELSGKEIKLIFRMRGSKLFAMQFDQR